MSLQRHLVQEYCKSGFLAHAMALFSNINYRNVLLWNVIIQAHVQKGQGKETLQLFDQMQQEGIFPDKVTFACVLSGCACQTVLGDGKRIHARLMNGKFESNIIVSTALVNMYGKSGSLKDAVQIFGKLQERDVVAWNAMITSYCQHGQGREALHLFEQMQQHGVMPNRVTFITVIEACAVNAVRAQGEQMYARIFYGELETDVALNNVIIKMYGKCGSPKDARRLFERMPKRDVVSWNAMIAVYAQFGLGQEALQLFDFMEMKGCIADKYTFASLLSACANQGATVEGKRIHSHIMYSGFQSDVGIGTAILSMYGKCCCLENARRVFDEMPEQNLISWNAMIAVYAQLDHGKEALLLFYQMQQQGVQGDKITFLIVLSACASEASLAHCKEIHACVLESGCQSDICVGSALVSMYGKCGRLEDARMTFDQMSLHNVVCWNAMMAVYAQHGQGKAILHLFDQMQEGGVMPDEVTFVSILFGCSHSGLLNEGLLCFAFMHHIYGINPSEVHYVCMIDLLGRAGQLEEAESLMNAMPFESNIVSFAALLSACKSNADVGRGEHIAKQVVALQP